MRLSAYERFVRDCRKSIARIARSTGGEHSIGDVSNELWLMALEVEDRYTIEFNFDNPEHRDLVLKFTYQKLVKYAETTVRYAKSMDCPWSESEANLYERLPSGNGVPDEFVRSEREQREAYKLSEQGMSLGNAWLLVLELNGNRMLTVARFLKLSRSQGYRRFQKVRILADCQRPLPLDPGGRGNEVVRPWRKFKCYRTPEQLVLPFETGFDF